MLKQPISPGAYQTIVNHAWHHLLNGGGIVPTPRGVEIENTITAIANQHFGLKEADDGFGASIAGLEDETRERISSAAWTLVHAMMEAAFTFGAAIGLQLHPAGMAPVTQPRKGGQQRDEPDTAHRQSEDR